MSRAIRSPGSTLKPLIYGLAFEAGIAHPETIVDDRPMRFGTYAPQNLDRSWLGPITARTALQASRNLPAVALLDAVGPAQLSPACAAPAPRPQLPPGGAPGLAIALGGVGLSLEDLVRLYAAHRRRRDRRVTLSDTPERRSARPAARRSTRPPPGMSPTSSPARRRPRTARPAGSPSRPAPATATATPGRSASTARMSSASGSAAPTAPRCRAPSASKPPRPRSSTPSPAFARDRRPCRPRRPRALTAHDRAAAGAAAALPAARRAETGGGPEIAFPPDGARVDLGLGRGAGRAARDPPRRRRAAVPLARRRHAAAGRPLRPAGRMAAGRRRLRRSRRHRRNRTRGAGQRVPAVRQDGAKAPVDKSADRSFRADRGPDVPPPAAGRQVDVPRTSETARAVAATMMSASDRVRQSGGAKPRISPCGMARPMTPRRAALPRLRADLPRGSKNGGSSRSSTNSTAASMPSPRTSPTFVWPAEGFAQFGGEIGAGLAGVLRPGPAVDQFEVGDAGGSADRMGGIGPAVADGAELVGALVQHLPHLVADDRARQRRIGRGQALGDGDEVGLDAVMVGAEHRAEAAEAGDDLVGDQQDVVFLEHRLDLLPVAGGRRHDAAGAEDRLADEGGDGIRPFARIISSSLSAQWARTLPRSSSGRRGGNSRALRCAGSARGRSKALWKRSRPVSEPVIDAGAVIAAPARDDLLLLRPAEDVVVVPDQLDVGLVGVRAGEAEIDPGHALRRAVDDHLGQRDRGLGAVPDIGVVVGEVLRLGGDRIGDLLAAVADIDAIEAGEGVELAVAVAVPM